MASVRTSVMGEVGDLAAPPGSREWAVAVSLDLQSTLNDVRGDAEHLGVMRSLMREHKGYKTLKDRRGRPFATYEGYCKDPQPFGLGIHPEDIDHIIGERREKQAQERAEVAVPLLSQGRPPKDDKKKGYDITFDSGRGTSADYLTARIARDRPDILDRMMAGEFPSVRKGPTMYLSPNHPDYERLKDRATIAAPTGPPAPTGTLIATFPRPSREGQDCELRLVLDEYQGNPYLSLRVWQRDASGAFWPTRRGVSVRMGEAEGVAAALVQALGGGEPAAPVQPTREAPPQRRQRPEGRRQWDDGGSPPPPSRGFDDAY